MKQINMSSASFHEAAHEHFAWMRREAPVYKAKLTRWKQVYVVSRYADVDALMKGERLVKNFDNAKDESGKERGLWVPPRFRPLFKNMLNSDEPDHRRLRSLVQQAFTPTIIRELRPRIEELADELADELVGRSEVDIVAGFSRRLPARVISELIGLPVEDRHKFSAWTARILCAPTPFNLVRALPALRQFLIYINELVDSRRERPRDDLMTRLVEAEAEGDRLTQDELVAMVFLLLIAGYETTVGMFTNGVLALLEHPEQLARLREEPELIPSAVEEILRYDGPVIMPEPAYAREPIELHGVTIPRGASVMPSLLSANRDEEAFERADEFDVTRSPNKHFAFGKGIHFCLGAPLARLEGEIGFATLLRKLPRMRLLSGREQLRYMPVPVLNHLERLPISTLG